MTTRGTGSNLAWEATWHGKQLGMGSNLAWEATWHGQQLASLYVVRRDFQLLPPWSPWSQARQVVCESEFFAEMCAKWTALCLPTQPFRLGCVNTDVSRRPVDRRLAVDRRRLFEVENDR